MKAHQSDVRQRIAGVKEELWKMRQHLDQAIRDPEKSAEDLQDLIAAHSAVVFEYKALHAEKIRETKELLASLKEGGVIDDYAVVKTAVQLRMGSEEVALEQDELFPYLRGLVQGRRHVQPGESDVEGVEFAAGLRSE